MSVMRFSDLPAASTLNDDDIIAVTQNGTSKQATIGQISGGTGGGSGGGGSIPRPANEIINGDFRISQRGVWFDDITQITTTDGRYLVDRWCHLSEGDDTWLIQIDDIDPPPHGDRSYSMLNLTADTRAGVYQAIEFDSALALRGQTVSVSLSARTGSGFNDYIDTIRAAVLTRNGTPDTFSTDIISTWNASGAEPTWADDWARAGNILDMDLTAQRETWIDYELNGISLPSDITNLALVIWIDDATITQYDFCQLGGVQLEIATTASDFIPRPRVVESALANQYAHGVNTGVIAWCNSATTARATIPLPAPLRKPPTVTAPVAVTGDQYGSNFSQSAAGITLIRYDHQSVVVELDNFSGLYIGGPLYIPDRDDPWLILEAEV